jgi:APA family basic amino acid/polyamine antiporter
MKSDSSSSQPTLLRGLGPFMAVAVVVGTTVGSGVFKKPQIIAAEVPYFGLAALAWILGGLLALLGALVLAEIAVLFPQAGGNYVFLREGYGRLAGFLWGWVEFGIIKSASIAALATIFSQSLNDMLRAPAFQEALRLDLGEQPLGFWAQAWLTVAVILILGVVNMIGVRWGGFLQLFITIIKIVSLVGIAVLPFVVLAVARGGWEPAPDGARLASSGPPVHVENLRPWWPAWDAFEFGKMGSALLAVLWAYHGWMNVATVAGEIRNPRRNVPLALFAGVAIIIALYLGANLGYCLVIPQEEMKGIVDTTVATEFSRRLLGPIGIAVTSAAVMCSVFGALNGNLLTGPRVLYAMGEDRLAPRVLGAVHPRFRTPAVSILLMAAWASVLVLAGAALSQYRLPVLSFQEMTFDINVPAGKQMFDIMTDFAMFGVVIFETLAISTIFVFRRRLPDADRPYRCLGYPFVPALYIAILALVATNMFRNQRTEALVGVSFIGVGALVYAACFRKKLG